MNDKITERHLRRKAILYIRQSTHQQLQHNDESRRLQYGMQSRLRELGWRSVDVIDDDLGRSAGGAVERVGFQRLVAEVSLGGVGAVAARELSRFARNSREWQQLIEVCRFVDTLLIDQDAAYDPRSGNDRLLLGLRGSLNEYELELLRARADEAKRAKASRGELVLGAPFGYVKTEAGGLEKDPDLRIQRSVQLLFDKALELGGARPVMLWLREHDLVLPYHVPRGRTAGPPKTPCYTRVLRILRNPTYAGAYVYGRRETVTRYDDGRPRSSTRLKPREEWSVLLRDHHPAYVEWERFERLQAMLDRNAQARWQASSGAAKKGSALLTGLLRCRRCGRKLMVRYQRRKHDTVSHRYVCEQASLLEGEERCISFAGQDVDRQVAEQLLDALAPAGIEAAALALQKSESEKDDLISTLETELEAARYAADRARRQYDAADPENRLVTSELERRWERALSKADEIETRLQRQREDSGRTTKPDSKLFEHLGRDLQSVWNDPAADIRLKKRIVQTLVEEVFVDVDDEQRVIMLTVHWKGGVHTELRVPKRQNGRKRASIDLDVLTTVDVLARCFGDLWIARWLNLAHVRRPSGKRWTKSAVLDLRCRHGIDGYSAERRQEEGWLVLHEATSLINAGAITLKRAVRRGELMALHPIETGPWIFKKSDVLEWREKRTGGNQGVANPADRDGDQLILEISGTSQGGAV